MGRGSEASRNSIVQEAMISFLLRHGYGKRKERVGEATMQLPEFS